jgi:hypothetical protein
VDVTPGSVDFEAVVGDLPPEGRHLVARYRGDGLLVGYPAGTTVPSWLSVDVVSSDADSVTVRIAANTTALQLGVYSATIRFVSGKADGSKIVTCDVPVTYRVNPGAFALEGSRTVTIDQGAASADLDLPLTLRTRLDAASGASRHWSISTATPWVTVTPSSGDLSADVPLVVHLDPDRLWALPNGVHTAPLTVQIAGSPARSFPLTLDLRLLPAITPASAAFAVNGVGSPEQLTAQVSVRSNLGEAFALRGGWQAPSSVPWMTASPATGSSAATTVTLALRPGEMSALPNGAHHAVLSIAPVDPRVTGGFASATLSLDLASVARVAPYTAFVAQDGAVVLRGSGFGAGPTIPVTFGGSVLTGTVVGPTEVRFQAPAQPSPGPVRVSIENLLGLARGGADLLVLADPGYGAFRVEVPAGAFYGRITTDPERQAVLLSGWGSAGFRRFRFEGNSWLEDAVALELVKSVTVSADGKELLALASAPYRGISVHVLDPLTLARRDTYTASNTNDRFDIIAQLNDGRTLVIDSDQWAETRWYPGFANGPNLNAWGTDTLLTRDRSRLLASTVRDSSIARLDASGSSFSSHPVTTPPSSGPGWAVSGDGGRLVIGSSVYGRDVDFLGALSVPATPAAVAIAPDGRWAYVLHPSAGNTAWVLARADVTAPLGPYAAEVVTPPLELPYTEYPVAMTVSEDGGALFVLTTGRSAFGSFFYALPLP